MEQSMFFTHILILLGKHRAELRKEIPMEIKVTALNAELLIKV